MVYVMQVRIIMMVMQDAFQIGAIQHCHREAAAPAAVCSLTLCAHFHKTIPLAPQHVSLSHHIISLNSNKGPALMGRVHQEQRHSVCRSCKRSTVSRAFVNNFSKLRIFTCQMEKFHPCQEFVAAIRKTIVVNVMTDTITARCSTLVNGSVRATLVARDCILSALCARLPPLQGSRPRPHLLAGALAIISCHLLPSQNNVAYNTRFSLSSWNGNVSESCAALGKTTSMLTLIIILYYCTTYNYYINIFLQKVIFNNIFKSQIFKEEI